MELAEIYPASDIAAAPNPANGFCSSCSLDPAAVDVGSIYVSVTLQELTLQNLQSPSMTLHTVPSADSSDEIGRANTMRLTALVREGAVFLDEVPSFHPINKTTSSNAVSEYRQSGVQLAKLHLELERAKMAKRKRDAQDQDSERDAVKRINLQSSHCSGK